MELVDTHCHIHSADYPLPVTEVEARATQAGVTRLICVGTDAADSALAVEFAKNRANTWASIGLHPHDAKEGEPALQQLSALLKGRVFSNAPASDTGRDHFRGTSEAQDVLQKSTSENRSSKKVGHPSVAGNDMPQKIIAIGECGLDYFYGHSSKADQVKALHFQIELALERNLPLIFHVRDAFDDFWPILDSYKNLRGVIHSFTDSAHNLEKALQRGLYIGVNGIMTFTKNQWQLEVAKNIPLDQLLIETDAPFLTPVPHRGKVNEPAHALLVARFLAGLRGEAPESVAAATTNNARALFSI
jgi:TatD DNase family protein